MRQGDKPLPIAGTDHSDPHEQVEIRSAWSEGNEIIEGNVDDQTDDCGDDSDWKREAEHHWEKCPIKVAGIKPCTGERQDREACREPGEC